MPLLWMSFPGTQGLAALAPPEIASGGRSAATPKFQVFLATFNPSSFVKSLKIYPALSFAAAILLLSILPARAADASPRERLLLDFGWKFHLGDDWGLSQQLDKAGVNPGPAGRAFADANWRTVNLPHDWAPELPSSYILQKGLYQPGVAPIPRGATPSQARYFPLPGTG